MEMSDKQKFLLGQNKMKMGEIMSAEFLEFTAVVSRQVITQNRASKDHQNHSFNVNKEEKRLSLHERPYWWLNLRSQQKNDSYITIQCCFKCICNTVLKEMGRRW
jgi:hypothetical protein